jgi:hypothetical protein
LTPRYEDGLPVSALAASAIERGAFSVRTIDGANPDQSFYWEVKAARIDPDAFDVELHKEVPA